MPSPELLKLEKVARLGGLPVLKSVSPGIEGRSLPEGLEMACKILELEEGSRFFAEGAAKS